MRIPLVAVLVWAACAPPALAKLVPYYRMDSLAYMSTDIILCDETEETNTTTLRVVRVLKGDLMPGERLTVDNYGPGTLYQPWGTPEPWPRIPLGRAVYFLKKENGKWQTAWWGSVRPIYKGEVYCYDQFAGNPGGLYLARMAPENFKLPDTEPYGEKELLADLEIALEKSKSLTGPLSSHPDIRKGNPPPPKPQPPQSPEQAPDLTVWVIVGVVAVLGIAAAAVWWLSRKRRPPET